MGRYVPRLGTRVRNPDRRGYAGHYDQSLADCGKAIELNPAYGRGWYNRGKLKIRCAPELGLTIWPTPTAEDPTLSADWTDLNSELLASVPSHIKTAVKGRPVRLLARRIQRHLHQRLNRRRGCHEACEIWRLRLRLDRWGGRYCHSDTCRTCRGSGGLSN